MPRLKASGSRLQVTDTRRIKPPEKKADPFYLSPEWRALMKSIIAARGRRCEDPAHIGALDPAARIFGDHIVELRDGGAPLDPANIMLVCGSCHTRKTAAARAERLRR